MNTTIMYNNNMELRLSILLLYILSCLYCVNCALIRTDSCRNNFISKCLEKSSVGDENCEDLRYPMLDSFYTCEVVGSFDFVPTRVGSNNGSFFVALNRKTFSITKPGHSPVEVNNVIPPTQAVFDKFNNMFYSEYGTTYMMDENRTREVKIVTSENDNSNELAMDYENNILFILSLNIERKSKLSGNLYFVQTDQIVVENTGKVRATKIHDFGKRFSAMTIPENSNFILLGISGEKKGGKLIKLIRNKNDPCPAHMEKRSDFHKTLREATERLIKIFDDAVSQNQNGDTGSMARASNTAIATATATDDNKHNNDQTEIIMLQMENRRLERKLNITTMKFESYSRRILTFSRSLKNMQEQPNITKVSVEIKGNGKDLVCLPSGEMEALKKDNLNLRNRVDLLENILSASIQVLETLGVDGVNDGQLGRPVSVEPPETDPEDIRCQVEVSRVSTESPENNLEDTRDLHGGQQDGRQQGQPVSTDAPEMDLEEDSPTGTDDDAAETDDEYRARLNNFFGMPSSVI